MFRRVCMEGKFSLDDVFSIDLNQYRTKELKWPNCFPQSG